MFSVIHGLVPYTKAAPIPVVGGPQFFGYYVAPDTVPGAGGPSSYLAGDYVENITGNEYNWIGAPLSPMYLGNPSPLETTEITRSDFESNAVSLSATVYNNSGWTEGQEFGIDDNFGAVIARFKILLGPWYLLVDPAGFNILLDRTRSYSELSDYLSSLEEWPDYFIDTVPFMFEVLEDNRGFRQVGDLITHIAIQGEGDSLQIGAPIFLFGVGPVPQPSAVALMSPTYAPPAGAGRTADNIQYTENLYIQDGDGPNSYYYPGTDVRVIWNGPHFTGLENYSFPGLEGDDQTVEDLEAWLDELAADFNSQDFIDSSTIEMRVQISYPDSGGWVDQAFLLMEYVPQKSVVTRYKRFNSVEEMAASQQADSFTLAPGYFKVIDSFVDDVNIRTVISAEGTQCLAPTLYPTYSKRNYLNLPRYIYSLRYEGIEVTDTVGVIVKAHEGAYLSNDLQNVGGAFPDWARFKGPDAKPSDFDSIDGFTVTNEFTFGETISRDVAAAIDSVISTHGAEGSQFSFSKISQDYDYDLGQDIYTTHTPTFEIIKNSDISGLGSYTGVTFLECINNVINSGNTGDSVATFSLDLYEFECVAYTKVNPEDSPETGASYGYSIGDIESSLAERATTYSKSSPPPPVSTSAGYYMRAVPANVVMYVILPGCPKNKVNAATNSVNSPPFDYNHSS